MPNHTSSALIIGTGFLGEAVVRLFTQAGWKVYGASYSGGENEFSCDLGDIDSVERLASKVGPVDFVLHCASSGRGSGIQGYERVYRDGTAHLVKYFPDSHLAYTSSSSVYGQTDGQLVNEESETIPVASTSEVLLEAEKNITATNGTVLRLAGLYGPERSIILKKFLNGSALIEDQGQRHLNQIHRDDAAAAVLHLAGNPETTRGETYNVADSSPLTQRECYHSLAKILDRPIPPSGPRDLNKKRGWTNKQVCNRKLRDSGWSPSFPSFLDAVPLIAPDYQ